MQGQGWNLAVPSAYYRPRSRAKVGNYDDTAFVAADYAAGRIASVSVTYVRDLLVDSGDPLPLQAGSVSSLKDLGKPNLIARYLAGRRDGDPLGLQPPRSDVLNANRVSDTELSFQLLTLKETATSQTTSAPGARRTLARTLLVPGAGVLVTAWATSDIEGAVCEAQPCKACGSLRCDCPPPKCSAPPDERDQLDERIVSSLQLR